MNPAIIAALISLTSIPVASFADILPAPRQIAPHSYVWIGPYGPPAEENRGFRMNLGFIVGNDSVAVIDSGYGDEMANVMLAQIRQITDRPVRYVINTNSQPHRILGNAAFRENGATVIASEAAAARMVQEGTAMAGTAENILGLAPGSIHAPGPPDRGLQKPTGISLGGVTLQITPLGTAHTAGSLVVEVVEDKVIFTGDILYRGRLPSILPVSRIDGWITAFDALRNDQDALFVPGHGEPGQLSDFEHSTYEYLTTLKTHMDNAIDQALELQEAIDSLDQSSWKDFADFDLLAGRNAHQTYLERESAAFE